VISQRAYRYLTIFVGVGSGTGMKESLMLIVYPDGNGKSTRVGRVSALNPG